MTEAGVTSSRRLDLHVEEAGAGPALLLGHGMFCTCRMFDLLVPQLAETHHVVSLDFPGHGHSALPRAAYTFDLLAAAYLQILDTLGIEQAVLGGFSMGGMAAIHFALAHPDRLHGLVLMNTSADSQTLYERQTLRLLGAITRKVGVHPTAVRSTVKYMFSSDYMDEHPETADQWGAHLAGMDPDVVAAVTRLIAERESLLPRLPEIQVPVLVLGATRDEATPPHHSRRIADSLPDARLRILDAGHATPLEVPEQVVDHLYHFLADIGH